MSESEKDNSKVNDVVEEPIIESKEKTETDAPAETQDAKETVGAEETKETSAKGDESQEEENAPKPPPRPVSPLSRIKGELKGAFPGIEEKYINAVLIASGGELDPAFNALLYISDPSFQPEIPLPKSSAPEPVIAAAALTDDEILARKLQKEFEQEERRRRRKQIQKAKLRGQPSHEPEEDSPDEFDQIKETFSQGLEEARTTLNGWVSGLAKKFQDKDENNEKQNSPNPKLFGALGGSSFNNQKQTSAFDEDPIILSNDFDNKIKLMDNDESEQPKLPQRRQQANDSLTQSDSFTSSNKKWQPLQSDAPVNSDAFLVTDSEDEENQLTSPKKAVK